MFSNRIANSARFLQMPTESQLLYFHFVLRADDDGIVESYPIMRLLGMAPDAYKVLLAKGFVRELNEDQVIVISDWLEHNTIRADRKVDSIYKPLLQERYPELPVVEPKPRSDVKDNSSRVSGGQSTGGISQVKLSKDKLIEEGKPTHLKFSSISSITEEILKELSEKYEVPIDFVRDCWDTAQNWLTSKGLRKADYRAFLSNWVKKDRAEFILKTKRMGNRRGGTVDVRQY